MNRSEAMAVNTGGTPVIRECGRDSRFANFDVVVRSWYVACRSKDVRRGRVRSFDFLNRRIAAWRDAEGAVHAVDARCPHLGADLGDGQVVNGRVQCAFHHWEFDARGTCVAAPGLFPVPPRRVRSYPVVEKWGLIWLFNGPEAEFELPVQPPNRRVWRLPRQLIQCHPHLVIGNGLDVSHFEALHGMQFSREPVLREDDLGLTVEIAGRPRSKALRLLTGTGSRDVEASFRTIGGNIAWVEVRSPIEFEVMFTGLPANSGCVTQTLVFLPRRFGLKIIRAAAILYSVLSDDRRVLDHLQFVPAWTERDEPLRRFAQRVDAMEVG